MSGSKRGPSEIQSFLELAARFKLKSLRVTKNGTELTSIEIERFEPSHHLEPIAHLSNEVSNIPTTMDGGERMPTEDEMLFYSTPHFDELMMQRLEHTDVNHAKD